MLNSLTDYFVSSETLSQTHTEDDLSALKNTQLLLQKATILNASDIHLEPFADKYRIRLRLDGILQEYSTISFTFALRIITCLKIMAKLDIAERRLPQDGRFRSDFIHSHTVDFRVSTCPTIHGEKVVTRILDISKNTLTIDGLGFIADQKNLLLNSLNKPQGMILVTGPTGSGKTVTLYSALSLLNKNSVNISTVEDPVEIHLPGINQINIQPKIGLDFATVLRALLRQDPDILMVGEIRDVETAEIALQAAQTGHLVLSTLHTNNAAETLTRLTSMKIPSYQIASSISLIIAQRLIRILCQYCKQKINLPSNTLQNLGFTEINHTEIQLFTAVGCEKCHQGYLGRTGIYECLSVTSKLIELILNNTHTHDIAKQAQNEGMMTLHLAGLLKVAQGFTSIQELQRVIRE